MAEKTIYARANPASVQLQESYYFEKKISRNPHIGPDEHQPPAGKIEIIVPYDGDQFFTRQAYNDVMKQLSSKVPDNNIEAQIGHLSLMNYDRTNLREVLDLNKRYGTFPIAIPILGKGISSIEQLYSDRLQSTITFDYMPDLPDFSPIDVNLELWDEATLSGMGPENPEADKQLAKVAEEITQQVNFHHNLLIKSRLWIDLPSHLVQEDVQPRIIQMSLKWPTITSFRGLQLRIGSPLGKEVHVIYNPETRCLEWGHIPMNVDPQFSRTGAKTFFADPMYLFTDYPGELYQQLCLEGHVEIEIPGLLLSGTQARLFNAIGEQTIKSEPKTVSRVNVKFELILDEAFNRRKLSPYQHLYFDEVIPDEMRVADIKTAIADRGFRIVQDKSLAQHDDIRYFIKAIRPEGPDTMELSMLIEGRRQEAERETQLKGGQKFKSNTESGYLRVYIRGELHGNSQRLTQEMNAFQTALHERFERLRSRR
jgi:hypothetical protein